MTERRALGKGAEALWGSPPAALPREQTQPTTVPIEKIFPNRSQPRERFDEARLQELSESIRKEGILQPLMVSAALDGRYELIAGERRWRGAQLAGLKEVPVLLREASEAKRLELALIENIQRQDLNPIEEARGYRALQDSFEWNPADIAERVGKSREHVTNTLRLLKLPNSIQEDVAGSTLSAGHARALLALGSREEQLYFRNKIVRETLSVRDVERLVQSRGAKKIKPKTKIHLSEQMRLIIGEMEKILATKVRFQPGRKEGKGQVVIDYYSWEDLDRIYRLIVDTKGENQWEKTTETG